MNAGSMYYVGKEYVRICYEYARRRLQTEIEWGTHETEREDIKKIEKEIDEENVRIVLFGQPGSGKST